MMTSQLARPALRSASRATTVLAGPSLRSFSTTVLRQKEVENVTVFGGGLMGSGIAQVLAQEGKYNVTLADVTEDALKKGKSSRLCMLDQGQICPDPCEDRIKLALQSRSSI